MIIYNNIYSIRFFPLTVLFYFCLLIIPSSTFASDTEFSPAVYAHVSSARSEIEQFVDCHSNVAKKVFDKLGYELKYQLFRGKTGNLLIALPGWFNGFTDTDYSKAFSSLISGREVKNIRKMYNEILEQVQGATKLSKLLYVMEKNDQENVRCDITYSDIHKRIAEQVDIAAAWLDLVYIYIDINQDYRGYQKQKPKLEEKFMNYKRTRDQLYKIEHY
jgi:hypothetical protein